MSAIAGIVHLDSRPARKDELSGAFASLARYGPHGSAIRLSGRAGFVHALTRATPEAVEPQQPWIDPKSGLLITADARLDDRGRLIRSLGLGDVSTNAQQDCQLILAAYRKWGTACVDYLLGDFAFAIWDAAARQLFCARDHLGLRPFCYHHSGRLLAFASSARAVLGCEGVPAAADRGRIADYLVQELEGINHTSTFYRDIQRLPPAHFAVLKDGSLKLHRYWKPEAHDGGTRESDEETLDRFSAVFSEAVSDRLRCPVPPAAMLSGGLDSSTIVGIARELQRDAIGEPLDTYSVVADDPDQCTESRFIQAVVGHGGLNAHLLPLALAGRADSGLTRVLAGVEEPWESMNAMLYIIYRAASADGHVVMLDGVDGDLVASLPESYPMALARRGRLLTAWREHARQRENYFRKTPSARVFLRQARSLLVPPVPRSVRQRLAGNRRLERVLSRAPLSRALASEVRLEERLLELNAAGRSAGKQGLRQACIDRVTAPFLAAANERYWRTAGACGIEARKPFLDKRVVEFCLSLPWDQKARDGWSKFTVRRLAETVLPESVAWRSGWEHLGWSVTEARLLADRTLVVDTLERNRESLSAFVDSDKYARALEQFTGREGRAGESLRILYGLACWLDNNPGLSV